MEEAVVSRETESRKKERGESKESNVAGFKYPGRRSKEWRRTGGGGP